MACSAFRQSPSSRRTRGHRRRVGESAARAHRGVDSTRVLGRAQVRRHVRVHAGRERPHVRALSAARSRSGEPEALSHDRHLPPCERIRSHGERRAPTRTGETSDRRRRRRVLLPRTAHAYIAFPGSDVQIEVYDPSASALRTLVTSGAIRRVGAPPRAVSLSGLGFTPAAVSTARLTQLAASLGQPIYWLGTIRGLKLELTRTAGGSTYIRYLPAGVPVGSTRPYLTVATYPVANGMAVTGAAARGRGEHRIHLPDGGLAFFSEARPTNIYVAFSGQPEQIEVFDPSARLAQELVKRGRVRAVP
jgi:hypothetical protein